MYEERIKVYLATPDDSPLVSEYIAISTQFSEDNVASELADFCTDPAHADIVLLFEAWSFKTSSYSSDLSHDPWIKQHIEKIYVINNDDVVGEPYLPGCYTSLKKSVYNSDLFRACAYPATYNELTHDVSREIPTPKYLFSFRGTLHSSPIRRIMYQQLKYSSNSLMVDNTKAFHTHTVSEKQAYINDCLESQFILCPRGWSPNTYRLYEAMSLARCPVIISDEWVETIGPDWNSCSIRVAEQDIRYIPEILAKKSKYAKELGQNARIEWEKHFTTEAKNQMYLAQIIQLYKINSHAQRSLTDYQTHWRSAQFRRNNGWLLSQRIIRRLNAILN